ncbi:yip1 domain-containing protein [Chrysochromulina tobinii]|uniref:Protein YIPF n=1 Tax=Chrysochromulina tobinii TaxID=1460289 RepID=A0A0M0JVM7_9EUKA|nr:yip1 domain-containing protein [Chrysochromulina tobinii]KOO34485.1 yip1 domain-containing protein [Chrysochromulina tobinii]|eukprot:KOO30731.1 yip1 domain-containing protein [Chrysochromulina sp. CCMP291]
MGADYGTLDEPVTETIMRDVRMVGNKMMCVLNPRKANIQTLKDWDLWGPLILCLMLATLLSWFAPYEQKSLVFASVFVIVWCGAAVVTVNALLLGGNISFFQSVCVLGYCIFPLNIASFMGELVPPNRKALAVYPLFLFYTAIGWLILIAAKRS